MSSTDIGYTFSPTANDGRLWKRKNYVSGEEVEYQYDALGRLSSAATVGAGGWGQSFVHDGFGNLLQQNVTKGSAPTMNLSINGNTNRVAGQLYDANGNWLGESGQPQMVYDIENRLAETPGGAEKYKYSVSGHRIMVQSGTTYRYHLYGIDGQLLGVYRPEWKPGANYCAKEDILRRRTYFGGRLLYYGENPTLNGAVVLDRLGTAGDNYPYGGATLQVDHKVGFATYTRDDSGLDYAVNRYYKSSWGRFTSPDQGPAAPENPQSWNRYAYALSDPANYIDPDGMLPFGPGSTMPQPPNGPVYGAPEWYWWASGSIVVGGWGTLSQTTQLFQAVDFLETIPGIDVAGRAPSGAGYVVNFSAAGTATAAATVCVAQPELCVIVAAGAGLIYTVYVTAPHLVELGRAILQNVRGQRDPAQVRSIPTEVTGTKDPNGDCIPPPPEQKGPAGKTFKWQQRSSAPGADPNATPRWHWTRWNFNPVHCTWYYNGRGESLNEPGPEYTLIPGVF